MRDHRHAKLMVWAASASVVSMAAWVLVSSPSRATTPIEGGSRGSDLLAYVELLRRGDLKERENAANGIRLVHGELVRNLTELARQPGQAIYAPGEKEPDHPWHERNHLAILLLGDLRASTAVSVLLENLEYRNPRELFAGNMDKSGWYPAVEALCKIGMPAVDPTVAKLGQLDSKSRAAQLCSWVLNKILGPRLARVRLEIAIEETPDATAKANLKAALPYFKTEQEKAAEERAKENKQGQK